MKNRNKKNSARDLIKLKSTYTARETIMKENDNTQSGENSLQANISTSNSSVKQANSTCSSKKTKTKNKKPHTHTTEMGQRSKWIFSQRMYPDLYKVHEKMLSIPNDWRYANQNYNEVSAKITESDYPPKDLQRLNSARSRGRRNHSTLGAGM